LCRVELAPRCDHLVRAWSSTASQGSDWAQYRLGTESRGQGWLDYVQGVTHTLAQAGHAPQGFNVRIDSAVPLGSGLSSSAALSVSLMRALREAFSLELDDVQIARFGQRSENEFVGAQVGIMDPMAASLADEGTALFLDARSLRFERVHLPAEADLIVLSSGVAHNHAAGDYNTRRAECERASTLLGVPQLRDLEMADLARVAVLPEPLNRRARHVVTENDRVLGAVSAMRAGDLPRLGELFYASHASMRDDYQVSVSEIDQIVDLAREDADIYGARLTGGGFGGSVVMLARRGAGRAAAERIAAEYGRRSGREPRILVPAA
jgi:galactokinase